MIINFKIYILLNIKYFKNKKIENINLTLFYKNKNYIFIKREIIKFLINFY